MAVIAGRNVGNNDLAIMGAGVLMFIDSFLPWFGITIRGFGSSNGSAWDAGFLGVVSTLLVIAVAGIAAARIFAGTQLPAIGSGAVTWSFILGSASVVAALFVLLRWVTLPSYYGAKIGLFIGLILAVVQAVFAYLSIVAAGEKLPWQKSAA